MYQWNQASADEFSKRVLKGQELTVTHDKKCFFNMYKPDQIEVAYHWFEMAMFVGFITCDSGGEIGRHYVLNN